MVATGSAIVAGKNPGAGTGMGELRSRSILAGGVRSSDGVGIVGGSETMTGGDGETPNEGLPGGEGGRANAGRELSAVAGASSSTRELAGGWTKGMEEMGELAGTRLACCEMPRSALGLNVGI